MAEIRKSVGNIVAVANNNRIDWDNLAKILGGVDGHATSYFTQTVTTDKSGNKQNTKAHPKTIVASNFGFDLPPDAYIQEIRFSVGLKVKEGVTARSPTARFCPFGHTDNLKDSDAPKHETGFVNGVYYYNHEKISTSLIPVGTSNYYLPSSQYKEFYYTMERDDIVKAKITASDINKSTFGVDFIFHNSKFPNEESNFKKAIGLAFVRCYITYKTPKYNVTITDSTESLGNNLSSFKETGKSFQIIAEYVGKYNSSAQDLVVTLPSDIRIDETTATVMNGSVEKRIIDGVQKWVWSVPSGVESVASGLVLNVIPRVVGTATVSIGNDSVGSFNYTYTVSMGTLTEEFTYTIGDIPDLSAGVKDCVLVNVKGQSSYNARTLQGFRIPHTTLKVTNITLVPTTSEVEWNGLLEQNDEIIGCTLWIAPNTHFEFQLNICFEIPPDATGEEITIGFEGTSDTYSTGTGDINRVVEEPHEYHIKNTHTPYTVKDHNFLTNIEGFVTVIDLVAEEIDSVMTQSGCSLRMDIKEDLNYIGCVPLEQTHFDPESTFKDTLLNQAYKNKKYMGKKLATDEDISLNVRLHPEQVTTIQGLVRIDKPIPINTNHKAFESDALNHRGWAEIYGIKVKRTNPSWYKCDIDVKYLTHNLDSRFKIHKGLSKIDSNSIPLLVGEVVGSGESLSDSEFFTTQTDGSYIYDSIAVLTGRNQFSLDEGQYFTISTAKEVATTSQISFQWYNTMLDEIRENNISRVITLYDNQGDAFTYEYHNISFYDTNGYEGTDENYCNAQLGGVLDYIKADVIAHARINGEMEIVHSDTIQLSIHHELDENEDELVEVDGDEEILYGSLINFEINNNILKVIDEGYNRQETKINDIKLDGDNYRWKVEFRNKNEDDDSSSVLSYVDLVVNDTLLEADYANQYSKMYVSPFPIADKNLLFVRDAEEGSIYYYQGDEDDEFSFIIEPYWQYLNGTDLRNDSGSSILSLDYAYRIVYIVNGLVSLGFNRLNGQLYLGKWDTTSKSYVTTHRLQLPKYDDININSISDDKIEIQASDSTFTIYRGHPYIIVKHPTEDILIDHKFTEVWAEAVGGADPLELPTYFDLANNQNILPATIGGEKTIDDDALEVETREITSRQSSSITESHVRQKNGSNITHQELDSNELYLGESMKFTISGTVNNTSDDLLASHGNSIFGKYEITTILNEDAPYRLSVDSASIIQSGDTTDFYARVTNWDGEGIEGETVYFYEEYEPTTLKLTATADIIQTGDYVDFKATLKDEDGSAIKNTTVYFYRVV